MNLMSERARWAKDMWPLLCFKREAYDKALTEAIRGLETARVELVKAMARIGNG